MFNKLKTKKKMTTKKNQLKETKVVTGKVRLSYVHVWEPVAIEGSTEEKYSVSLIIPKSDTKTIAKISEAIENAIENGKSSKFGGKTPPNLKRPLRDGDLERPDDDAYANSYFINASSRTRPGVVDISRNPIIDQDEVYSGCFGITSITLYPFNVNGNKGVACGLNHIMKIADGEPLGGRSSAESDFAEIDASEWAVADIEDDIFG